jgi:exopolysaccharide production protein ExoZ
MAAPKVKLLGVQYLRAAAALMIVYLHTTVAIPEYRAILRTHALISTSRFNTGVDIFFVISGFIMMVTGTHSRPGSFLIRRVLRIVPLYWTLTLLLAAVYYLAPLLFRTVVVRPDYLLKSLLFIPYPNPAAANIFAPLLIPGWTLNLEMFFYLIFALLLPVQRWRVAIAGFVFAGLFGLGQVLDPEARRGIAGFYATPQILDFWLGMLIGSQYLRGRLRFPRIVCWALIIGSLAALLFAWPQPYEQWLVSWMLPAATLVLGVVALEQSTGIRRYWLVALLGDASYSIYLTQILSLPALRMVWTRFVGNAPRPVAAVAFAVSAMVTVCAGAVLTYRLVERPLLRLGKRMTQDPASR